jgi:hypothetical protein
MQFSQFMKPRLFHDTLISDGAATGGVGEAAEFTGAHCTPFVQLAAAELILA